MTKRISKISVNIIAIAILIVAGYGYWHHQQLHPSTNDAYVQANVIHVAAQVTGPVSTIYVKIMNTSKPANLW